MIKPRKLHKGDKVVIVSLSSGLIGEEGLMHRYLLAKDRLEKDFGLEVVTSKHALMGCDYIYHHPEERALDFMEAFKDPTVHAIFSAIGGDDTIRILPYIDFDVIKNNPKIFMGYSDTTVNHFMMHKAGIVSYYGPAVMVEIGDYVKIDDYVANAITNVLFKNSKNYMIPSCEYTSNGGPRWDIKNINVMRSIIPELHHYEVLNGSGTFEGELLGGCIDVFPMIIGTSIWPSIEEWKNKILFIETSEEKMPPDYLLWYLRNLGAQGILNVVHGILVGKPQDESYYNEYKEIILKVLNEFNPTLGVLYNVNCGHSFPNGILPLGIKYEVDLDNKTIRFLESATE